MSIGIEIYTKTDKGVATGVTALTGTFATNDTILIGTGTLFLTELNEGDWIYSTTDNEVRKVMSIYDDTGAGLKTAFTNNQTAQTLKVCRNCYVPSIYFEELGTGVSKINGVDLPNGGISAASTSGISPITYDATAVGASLSITIVR